MPWHLLRTRAGDEFEAEERVKTVFRDQHWRSDSDVFLLAGLKATCPRRDRIVRLENYAVFPTHLFIKIEDWHSYRHEYFGIMTRTKGFVRDNADKLATVPESVMLELFQRAAKGEFNNWMHKAIEFFKGQIGAQITIPDGELKGWPATIQAIDADTVLCTTEMLGHTFKRRIKLKCLWPKESAENAHVCILELGKGMRLIGNNPDFESPPADPMPVPEPFAVEARPAPFRHRQPSVATPEDAPPVSFATMPAPEVAPTLRTQPLPAPAPETGVFPRLVPANPAA